MNAADRIIMAKVNLQKEQPFFSYILTKMKIEEADIKTVGIDANGNIKYSKDFIEKLRPGETKGVLVHELLHYILEHMSRLGSRDMSLFNIATDIVVNSIVIKNDFTLPSNGLVPHADSVMIMGHHILNISTKTAEQVYDELDKEDERKISKETATRVMESLKTDEHNYGPAEEKQRKELKKTVSEAAQYAKMQGTVPAGMERIVDVILNDKLPWKQILYKYIINEIPFDFSWSRPSKKSMASGIYLPHTKRENIDIIVSVDTSGSINDKELREFISEVAAITCSFSNVKLTVIVCDNEIQGTYEVTKENITDIKLEGGGGTSHIPVFQWVEDNKPNAKLLIAFTDGYTEFPREETVKTIWVCNTDKTFPFGEVINV